MMKQTNQGHEAGVHVANWAIGTESVGSRPPRPNILVLDLDGTVLDWRTGHAQVYESESLARGIVAHENACRMAHEAAAAGWTIVYLTGREELVRRVTELHILQWLPPGMLLMQRRHTGMADMRVYKARWLYALKKLAANIRYAGDFPEDEGAAVDAGVPFVHADTLRVARSLDEALGTVLAGEGRAHA